jgi:toxin-antitoxin system PIN domain toxin
MLVPDINLLLYATNRDAPLHDSAVEWWEGSLGGREPVGLAWLVVLGFIRIATNARIFPKPLSAVQALAVVDDWFRAPAVRPLEPTDRHWSIFQELIGTVGSAGNLTSDAHLAALAIEHGALLCSSDRDFGRFSKLRWLDPLQHALTSR